MEIAKKQQGDALELTLSGRLDTVTAPQLEAALSGTIDTLHELVFDFTALEYISSAGLRVLLSAQKTMNRQGKMTVRGVCDAIREVFDITGFSDILTIE